MKVLERSVTSVVPGGDAQRVLHLYSIKIIEPVYKQWQMHASYYENGCSIALHALALNGEFLAGF